MYRIQLGRQQSLIPVGLQFPGFAAYCDWHHRLIVSERCQLEKLLAIVGLSSLPHSPLINSNLQQINKHQLEGNRDRMEVHTHHLALFIDLTSRRPTGAVVPAMKRARNELETDSRHRRIGNQSPSSVLLFYVSVVKRMSRHINWYNTPHLGAKDVYCWPLESWR